LGNTEAGPDKIVLEILNGDKLKIKEIENKNKGKKRFSANM